MLERADSLKEEVDYFVRRLGIQEKDTDKARKLLTMQLTAAEWEHVGRLLNLLGVRLPTSYVLYTLNIDENGTLAC